jgi:hypothetical protein
LNQFILHTLFDNISSSFKNIIKSNLKASKRIFFEEIYRYKFTFVKSSYTVKNVEVIKIQLKDYKVRTFKISKTRRLRDFDIIIEFRKSKKISEVFEYFTKSLSEIFSKKIYLDLSERYVNLPLSSQECSTYVTTDKVFIRKAKLSYILSISKCLVQQGR